MKVIFRVDGNRMIGLGHVMRCLSLADALKTIGSESVFVLSNDDSAELIRRRGHDILIRNGSWDDYDDDIEGLLSIVKLYCPDWVITDSYYASDFYFMQIHYHCRTAVISEAIPLKELHGVDLFVNYNYYMNQYSPDHANYKMCLGSKYALLRDSFVDLPYKTGEQILILTGGSDQYGVAAQIVMALADIPAAQGRLTLVSAGIDPSMEGLRSLCNENHVCLLENVIDMASVMQNAEIAISAGGSTLYELCVCGVPTITYSFADNQLDNVLAFSNANIMPYAGDYRFLPMSVLSNIVLLCQKLLSNDELRSSASHKMRTVCDGHGAMRIALVLSATSE